MWRKMYLESAGFPVFFSHMYEEPDYSLQCYALGYEVRFEPSLRIRHHVSAVQREPIRRHHFNARNELWSVWMRCPFPQVIPVSFFRIWAVFLLCLQRGFFMGRARAVLVVRRRWGFGAVPAESPADPLARLFLLDLKLGRARPDGQMEEKCRRSVA